MAYLEVGPEDDVKVASELCEKLAVGEVDDSLDPVSAGDEEECGDAVKRKEAGETVLLDSDNYHGLQGYW